MRTELPTESGTAAPPPLFGPLCFGTVAHLSNYWALVTCPTCIWWGSSPPLKGAQPQILKFWPNGWMDQDATWYGGRPRLGDIVLDGDPAPHGKTHSTIAAPHFSAHVYCGETVAHLSNCWALVTIAIMENTFNIKYLENGERPIRWWCQGSRIGNHPWAIDWHRDLWPRMTEPS